MSDTPTPRTDAFFDALYKDVPDEMTELSAGQEREFARQLERELAEANEATKRAKSYKRVLKDENARLRRELTDAQDRIDDLTATGIHSCGNDCKRPNCVLRRELAEARLERDNALSDWRQANTDSIRAIGERNEARESEASEARWAARYKQQRDALADDLRELMFDCLRFRIEPSDDAYKNAESSLAALEGMAE